MTAVMYGKLIKSIKWLQIESTIQGMTGDTVSTGKFSCCLLQKESGKFASGIKEGAEVQEFILLSNNDDGIFDMMDEARQKMKTLSSP